MSSKSIRWVIGGVLLGTLLCFATGIEAWVRFQSWEACHHDRAPLHRFTANIVASQRQQLVEDLKEYAHRNGFQFQASYYTPNGDQFLIDLKRHDVEVLVSNPFAPGEFRIGFYNNDCTQPTSAADIGPLVSDLKSGLGEIPGARFSEEK